MAWAMTPAVQPLRGGSRVLGVGHRAKPTKRSEPEPRFVDQLPLSPPPSPVVPKNPTLMRTHPTKPTLTQAQSNWCAALASSWFLIIETEVRVATKRKKRRRQADGPFSSLASQVAQRKQQQHIPPDPAARGSGRTALPTPPPTTHTPILCQGSAAAAPGPRHPKYEGTHNACPSLD